MQALGLSLGDLFPDRGAHHRPAGKPRIPASDILRLIDHETAIVEIAASDIGNGFDLSVDDLARVQVRHSVEERPHWICPPAGMRHLRQRPRVDPVG